MTKRFHIASIAALAALLLPLALIAAPAGEEVMTIPEGIDLVTPERIGNPNAEITLVWSPQQVYGPFSDIPARTSYLREKLEEWTRAHPNVKIEPVVWGGDANAFYAKLAAEAASGRAPDAVQMPDLPIYNQWLQSIDQYVRDELDDFFPWTHEIMIDPADGKIKRIKFNTGTGGLWYRRDSGAGGASFLRRADSSCQEVAGRRNGKSDRSGQRADLPPDFPDVVFSGQVLVRRERATDLR